LLKRGFEARCLAVRFDRYFGNRPCFRLAPQSQYDIALVKRDRFVEMTRQVQPTGT
jgi:plasmid maintenance system antidote protein VapI